MLPSGEGLSRLSGHTQYSGIGKLTEFGTCRGAGEAGVPAEAGTLSCRECTAEWSFTYTDDIHTFAILEIPRWQQCG